MNNNSRSKPKFDVSAWRNWAWKKYVSDLREIAGKVRLDVPADGNNKNSDFQYPYW